MVPERNISRCGLDALICFYSYKNQGFLLLAVTKNHYFFQYTIAMKNGEGIRER
jgi:hypothetical protein